MCDPVTIALTVGTALAGAAQQKAIARQQEAAGRKQAEDAYKAAADKLDADYEEANRQIGELQEQEVEEASDLIREANEELGTLRVAETALSDASLGNLYFENFYTNSVDLQRLDENTDKAVASAESSKEAARQGYLNSITLAKNRATNINLQTAAMKASANLQVLSATTGSITGQMQRAETLDAIKKGKD